MKVERVGSRMIKEPFTLRETDTLRTAVEVSVRERVRHLPVLGPEGELVGILTDRDIKRALPSPAQRCRQAEFDEVLDQVDVGRVMTREPIVVSPTTPIAEAVRLMVSKRIGGLPVVSQGRVVGIFTKTDALRAYLDDLRVPGLGPRPAETA